MTTQISHIFTTYDQPPYTTQSGQFPFIDIGGVFSLYSTSYTPADLANLTWSQIAAKLSNPNDQVTKDIVGNANILTAATCIAIGDRRSAVGVLLLHHPEHRTGTENDQGQGLTGPDRDQWQL